MWTCVAEKIRRLVHGRPLVVGLEMAAIVRGGVRERLQAVPDPAQPLQLARLDRPPPRRHRA